MRSTSFLFVILVLFFVTSACEKKKEINLEFIENTLDFAIEQYKRMEVNLPDSLNPRSIDPEGNLISSPARGWVTGFYPGTLWYLYEYSDDNALKELAHTRTMLVEQQKYNTRTHDLGFMLYCSFGNGFRLTGNPEYKDIMLTGAESLLTRYNETVGCIRSWDHGSWHFPVIIDNMMNLEFLFWAANEKQDDSIYDKCISHAGKTIEHHYRDNYSSFHLVDFDTLTGNVIQKKTVQGYADESSWARGQAWGLYGFTMMHRETRDVKYLQHAQKIADYLIHHPNLPKDKVPYWDFNAPDIPDATRDASAGAIIASALIELSDFTEGEQGTEYLETAKKIVLSLGSDKYLCKPDENWNFLLKHSVGNMNADSEVDVPLIYADYYFVEALLRLKDRIGE